MKIFEALEAGKELQDPAGWKNKQITANLVVVVLGGLLWVLKISGFDFPVTDETLKEIATIVAGVLSLVNAYLTIATSNKVGLLKE